MDKEIKLNNWLITGGCGFIGKIFIKHLKSINPNFSIRVIDNLKVGTREELSFSGDFEEVSDANNLKWESGITQLIVEDILEYNKLLKITSGADVIIHLAANTGVLPSVEDPKMDFENNVIGTFNLLETCRINKIKKFVMASSGAAAGEVTPPIHEEVCAHPTSPYGASKLVGESYCSAYYNSYGVNTVALRFSNVYGPGSTHKNSIVAKFTKRAINGEVLEIYGDGSQTRDFVYTEDLLNAIYLSAIKDIGGEVFQIASNNETTVLEITDLLVKTLKSKGIENIEVIHGSKNVGEVYRNYADTSKAQKILGWNVKMNLEQGIENTVEWFFSLDSKIV
ncbi:NAD-dependent epimerase/dehydratase family protein [Urechidicola croceus]|uniref:Epimerase n=1 Tax=Urechidicola croceus TaxID=1850246 RepID=A0A1D8P9C6_9FLAO|nr:NAD-dependent epimerase/dehydratase family protein [Urechidicola croceus]AOW21174.1 epimerase [Urechidicola croceus]